MHADSSTQVLEEAGSVEIRTRIRIGLGRCSSSKVVVGDLAVEVEAVEAVVSDIISFDVDTEDLCVLILLVKRVHLSDELHPAHFLFSSASEILLIFVFESSPIQSFTFQSRHGQESLETAWR